MSNITLSLPHSPLSLTLIKKCSQFTAPTFDWSLWKPISHSTHSRALRLCLKFTSDLWAVTYIAIAEKMQLIVTQCPFLMEQLHSSIWILKEPGLLWAVVSPTWIFLPKLISSRRHREPWTVLQVAQIIFSCLLWNCFHPDGLQNAL